MFKKGFFAADKSAQVVFSNTAPVTINSVPGGIVAPTFTPTGYPTGNTPTNLAVANFNNDANQDIAVWRPSTGAWYVPRSSDGAPSYFPFGLAGDVPIPSVFVR